MKLLVIMGIILVGPITWASQCATLSLKQAEMAHKILSDHHQDWSIPVVDQYCEACMDQSPKPLVVDEYQIKTLKNRNFAKLIINNKVVDSAYIYIGGENLAHLIDCKTIAVSQNLD